MWDERIRVPQVGADERRSLCQLGWRGHGVSDDRDDVGVAPAESLEKPAPEKACSARDEHANPVAMSGHEFALAARIRRGRHDLAQKGGGSVKGRPLVPLKHPRESDDAAFHFTENPPFQDDSVLLFILAEYLLFHQLT
jgi:hypothetical protein